jgi:hypothetical protein
VNERREEAPATPPSIYGFAGADASEAARTKAGPPANASNGAAPHVRQRQPEKALIYVKCDKYFSFTLNAHGIVLVFVCAK